MATTTTVKALALGVLAGLLPWIGHIVSLAGFTALTVEILRGIVHVNWPKFITYIHSC